MSRLAALAGKQAVRVVLLLAILGLSGTFLGLAAGYPISRIQFEDSDAVRLDQSQLAGQIDPEQAVVTAADLPIGWQPGDPALSAFGLLGAGFCGEQVDLPPALSDVVDAVFSNPADSSFLISQAIRLDRWQNARAYLDDVEEAVDSCDRFFRSGLDGSRVEVDIEEAAGDPPITDHVARTFVAQDGDSVQTWSMMVVGDVVVTLLYGGQTAPQQGFLPDLEDKILIRVDPEDFAPGGVAPTTTTSTTAPADPTATTVLESGPADEPATPPAPDASGGTTSVPPVSLPEGFEPTD